MQIDSPNSQIQPTSQSDIFNGSCLWIFRGVGGSNQPTSFEQNGDTSSYIPTPKSVSHTN